MSVNNSPAKLPVLAIVGMFALALAGIGLLALALVSLLNDPAQTTVPTVTAAATSADQVVFVPTTTPAPPTPTLEPTVAATEAPPPTAAPEVTAPPASQIINIIQPANVRSGPGTTFPILGGINTGETASVVGRDGTGTWFAISTDLPGSTGGVAWVSNLVATFDGDASSLPVVQSAAAPPPPPAGATATTAPAGATSPPPTSAAPVNTAPPPVSGARGLVGNYFHVNKTTVAAGELIWFQFQVVNTSESTVSFGMLAAHTDVGFTASSWNEALTAGRTLTHEDHIKITTPGTYQLYLGVCFNASNACVTGAQAWDRLSNYVTVTVQ
jgi:hypothetical protein